MYVRVSFTAAPTSLHWHWPSSIPSSESTLYEAYNMTQFLTRRGRGQNDPNAQPRDVAPSTSTVTRRGNTHRNIFSSTLFAATLLSMIFFLGNIFLAPDETVRLLEDELKKEKMKTKELKIELELLQNKTTSMVWYEKPQPILSEFPPVGRRLEFLRHLEKLPSFKTGVEVGVQKGILAKKSLDIWKSCTEYVLVDLWGKEEGYTEPGTDTASDKNAYLQQTRNRMKPWVAKGIVEFFVMRSTDASKRLLDNHFDYIYLDARHDYCAVKEDIDHYWPKLRPGGILGGHDYIDAQYAIDKLGPAEDWSKCEDGSIHPEAVKGAVDEFRTQQGGLAVYTSNEDFPSWYVQKPY